MVNITYKPKPIHVHVPLNLKNHQRTSAVALMHADWLTRLTLLGTRQTLRSFLFGGCSVQMGFAAFSKIYLIAKLSIHMGFQWQILYK